MSPIIKRLYFLLSILAAGFVSQRYLDRALNSIWAQHGNHPRQLSADDLEKLSDICLDLAHAVRMIEKQPEEYRRLQEFAN